MYYKYSLYKISKFTFKKQKQTIVKKQQTTVNAALIQMIVKWTIVNFIHLYWTFLNDSIFKLFLSLIDQWGQSE